MPKDNQKNALMRINLSYLLIKKIAPYKFFAGRIKTLLKKIALSNDDINQSILCFCQIIFSILQKISSLQFFKVKGLWGCLIERYFL